MPGTVISRQSGISGCHSLEIGRSNPAILLAAPAADARCHVPAVLSWRDGQTACDRRLANESRMAHGIEFAVLP
jgi:hypothetical protein